MEKRAKKVKKYVVEPRSEGFSEAWESFHATNPSCIRLPGYDGVFLAYRAGGKEDRYYLEGKYVWGSSMGLCILDSRGEEVVYRFPLPIYRCDRHGIQLPQTKEEAEKYKAEHGNDIVVLHDFRLFSLGETLYVLMHEGSLYSCYDTIFRIPISDFIARVERSKSLIDAGKVTKEAWGDIWWKEGIFTPCGNGGSNRFWASSVNKTDIVVIELDNGKLQLNHRAVPDYAVIETEGEVFSPATQDGFTRYGVLENCVRPGFFDNSHVGNNGNPVRMTVRGVPVYMDIVHGVNNASITDLNGGPWDMSYVPYLRLKSTQTGEVIFYSQEPVLVFDEIWKEYVQDGAWVSKLSHLRGVMFAGGQVAKDPAKISEYDEFTFYTGAGDTAVARADFRLCDLMEESEMDEVGNYRRNAENRSLLCLSENALMLPPLVKGWNYEILNKGGRVSLRRTLIEGICAGETALRPIHSCAGYFDFGGSAFDGKSLYETEYGLVAAIKGFNYRYAGQCIHTVVGYGVVILSKEHPEKILYHSEHSIVPTEEYEGNTIGSEFRTFTAEELLASVPEKVLKEILMTYKMIKDGTTFSSDHKKWLESRI